MSLYPFGFGRTVRVVEVTFVEGEIRTDDDIQGVVTISDFAADVRDGVNGDIGGDEFTGDIE